MVAVDLVLIAVFILAGVTGLKLYFFHLGGGGLGKAVKTPALNLHFYIALAAIVLAAIHAVLNWKVLYGRLKILLQRK